MTCPHCCELSAPIPPEDAFDTEVTRLDKDRIVSVSLMPSQHESRHLGPTAIVIQTLRRMPDGTQWPTHIVLSPEALATINRSTRLLLARND